MRCILFSTILFLHLDSFSQTPDGRLYFFTVPGAVIPAYLGYIDYPGETNEAIDSMLFDQFVDITMVGDKLFAALLEDVVGYDTTTHSPGRYCS